MPLALTAPRQGHLGWVGALDIEAKDCRIYVTAQDIQDIQELETHAAVVAASSPYPTAE